MNQHNNLHRHLCGIFLLVLTFLFSGCVSTENTNDELECRPKSTEECSVEEGDEGEERGYDPCLVNKNLPVCNT